MEGKELSLTDSGEPIRKLVAVSGESGQWHDQHSNWDKEENVNFRNSLETDSVQYWDVGDKKKGVGLGLGGHGDLSRVIPVDSWGVEGGCRELTNAWG